MAELNFTVFGNFMTEQNVSLPQIVDRVIDAADGETVSLDTVVQSVGRAGFTPLLLVPALAVASPLSGIPLFSSLMGFIIVLVSAQMLLRRKHLWLPGWVLRREVKGERVRTAFGKVRPFMDWIDRHTQQRLSIFVHRPLIYIPQLLCLASGLLMPVLEFVPFSSSIMGVGVVFLALGMVTRDGLLALLALIPYTGVAYLIFRFI